MNFSKFLLGLTFALFFVGSTYASDKVTKLDTIYKVEGKIMTVDVIKVTTSYVSFYVPGSDDLFRINRKEVHKIKYGNGKVEQYSRPVVVHIDNDDWKAVWVTKDKRDVADLHKRKVIKVHAEPSFRSVKAAKTNATIKLKKQTAANKGQVVLVTVNKATGGYGQMNGYFYEGVVYGTEPLEEEATEVTGAL